MGNVGTIIPAGGCGNFDGEKPKVCEPIHTTESEKRSVVGQTVSVVDSAVQICRARQGKKVIVTNGHLFPGQVENTLQAEGLAQKVEFVPQMARAGSANAVELGLDLLSPGDEWVLVTYGDMPLWTPETISRLISTGIEQYADLAMVGIRITKKVREQYKQFIDWSRILIDDDGDIIGIYEPRYIGNSDCEVTEEHFKRAKWANPSLFFFRRDFLEQAIVDIPEEDVGDGYEPEKNLTRIVKADADVRVVISELSQDALDEARGINTPEELEVARQIIAQRSAT